MITATFSWHGDTDADGIQNVPPPPSVYVKETSSATVTYGSITTCDNGLPGQTSPRYTKVDNPGQSFAVTCTPAIEATYGAVPGTANVSYTAAASMVDVMKIEFSNSLASLTNWNADFATSGGTPYSFKGWQSGIGSNPVLLALKDSVGSTITPQVKETYDMEFSSRLYTLKYDC